MGCASSSTPNVGAPIAPTLLSSKPHIESNDEVVQGKLSRAKDRTSSPDDACVQHVLEASVLENEAVELDRVGSTVAAMAMYRECEKLLDCSIEAANLAGHIYDRPKLEQHRREVHKRIEYLSSLGGHSATIPAEEHIKPVQLSMKHTKSPPASSTVDDGRDMKTLAVYAAVGAGAGFLVLGGTLAVVGGAAGGAYLATRQGNAGDAVRAAGDLAAVGADKAKELTTQHEVAEKIAEASNKVAAAANHADEKFGLTDKLAKGFDVVVQKGKDIDEKHKVTQALSAVLQKGKDIDDKHQVSENVSSGFATGMDRMSGWLGRQNQSVALPTSDAVGRN